MFMCTAKTFLYVRCKILRLKNVTYWRKINVGVHDIPWLYCPDKISKFDVNFKQICHIFFNFSVKLYIVASLRITSSRQF